MHAHVSVESADCDGRYSRTYVILTAGDQDELEFKKETVGRIVYGGDNGYIATFTDDGFSYGGPTDEGFENIEVDWCTDDDADVKNTYRDHSAEAAGY